ncbi:MAG: ATP-binding protein [Anaerovoracaceae bacterium]
MKQKINLMMGIMALIAVVITVMGITVVYYEIFQNQVRGDLRQSAELLMETEVFQNAYDPQIDNTAVLEQLRLDNLRITWIDADGTVLFDNDTEATGLSNHLDRPEIREAIEHGSGEITRRSDTMNMNTFYYALLLENGTILRVSTQARNIISVLASALPVIAAISVIILLGCVLIGYYLTRQLMRPIREMAENLDNISGVSAYRELEPFAEKIRSQHENILAAAKSRQDFTANVSHELKTPIAAISGYAELIENHMTDGENEAYIAKQIRHNADRLLSLITDIIQLSELDHGELPKNFEHMDLFEAAQECAREHQSLAERKHVRLICTGISAGIHADPGMIREMIDNLIQNAIRYNRENGSVEVHVSIQSSHPVLTIRDTGIGIPLEHQERVFERFYRVDKSRSRETGGTGLGLAIVKHIAEIHSAEIQLNSVPGQGTEISVRF